MTSKSLTRETLHVSYIYTQAYIAGTPGKEKNSADGIKEKKKEIMLSRFLAESPY